ncbi:hypothetical protein [Nonomuraea sp. NPDC048826]|uniref:hypothetical protein n=1 Tax=Nonomuraea sp. NPDC048826 TaxID=3364347 RepID=UPI00371EA57F
MPASATSTNRLIRVSVTVLNTRNGSAAGTAAEAAGTSADTCEVQWITVRDEPRPYSFRS